MLLLTFSPAGLSLRAREDEIMAGSVKGLAEAACGAVGRRAGGVYLLDRLLGAKGGKSCF